jgi:anthranilate synthase component 1
MPSYRLVRIPLGTARRDAGALLAHWLAVEASDRGFVIEKEAGAEAFVGAAPFETLRVRRGRALSEAGGKARALPGNPFEALGRRLAEHRVRGARPFETGAVGALSYEMARHLERLPLTPEPEEARVMLFSAVARLDRKTGRAELCALIPDGRGAKGARRRARELAGKLALAPLRDGTFLMRSAEPKPARGGGFYTRGVRALKDNIGAGDIFQAVLSESFSAPYAGEPLALLAKLRALGPCPYLYYLRDGETHLVGASPERLVRVLGGAALNCPIAGTRPRGKTAAADKALERELRRDPKERAEHLMLVDLGRNDLGRVCAPGTVRVKRLMATRRFPNVMHLVSEVEGKLDAGKTAWDALAASFPAGTVSGAPKVRAMELLAALEKRPRGFYAGAVVQHDFSGNLDSCIAIRSAEIRGGKVRVQAGAGIVADSRPGKEWDEVRHKLGSLREALS